MPHQELPLPVEELLRINVKALPPVDAPTFGNYFHDFGRYKVVLIGDASHGTSEFYAARAKITQVSRSFSISFYKTSF